MPLETTWGAAPRELLWHAAEHLSDDSAADRKIAFLSSNHAVELTLRAFVELVPRLRPQGPPRAVLAKQTRSFPELVRVVGNLAPEILTPELVTELDFLHDLRNALYHKGWAISIERDYVTRFYEIATTLLTKLLGIPLGQPKPILQRLRAEARTPLLIAVRQELAALQSEKVKLGMARTRARGARLGRPGKDLTPAEVDLARQLLKTNRTKKDGTPSKKLMGWDGIANEINRRRRAFDYASPETQRKFSVSGVTVKRRLLHLTRRDARVVP